MTKIDDHLISKLEKLSRLQLETTEKEKIKEDLNSIVEMFDKLEEVDTDGVAPIRHVSGIVNRKRHDVVSNELSRDQALSNVKSKKEGFIAVPKFLKPK